MTVGFDTAAGGGYGSPLARAIEKVERDVRDGVVSLEQGGGCLWRYPRPRDAGRRQNRDSGRGAVNGSRGVERNQAGKRMMRQFGLRQARFYSQNRGLLAGLLLLLPFLLFALLPGGLCHA